MCLEILEFWKCFPNISYKKIFFALQCWIISFLEIFFGTDFFMNRTTETWKSYRLMNVLPQNIMCVECWSGTRPQMKIVAVGLLNSDYFKVSEQTVWIRKRIICVLFWRRKTQFNSAGNHNHRNTTDNVLLYTNAKRLTS